ncbi:hypothetical protein UA08_03379 [Talaromyces atroroseus]|uniref:Alpha/beta hydrolase fold-3 domain-containing protein n=1 Tax=Talaromyces atroroseus TaxID=1441469 RepID=A0A225B1X1_TALAT|nr:hypothetical protein UA08_03379 [Talaromyces atroroseus]OKL61216.1 hypothetical protein UA08_03379 [Talaromyces atroroseus]
MPFIRDPTQSTKALIEGSALSPRFSNFSIFQANYKTVGDHGIRADFMIPKSLRAGEKVPVITQFHGGGLIFGDSLYSPWFPIWVLELAEKHNAVIACANYRMMPESTAVEVLSDIDDWWRWLHSSDSANLLAALPTPIELDLDRVITTGESAGGLLSVYLAMTYPEDIRAATAGYPMFNQDGPVETDQTPALAPQIPESALLELQKTINAGNTVSSDDSDLRMALFHSFFRTKALLFKCYDRDSLASPVHRERLYQLQRLEQPDTKLPLGGLVILHGAQDPVVPVTLSERFVNAAREKLRGRQGADNIVLSIQEGVHGFDNTFSIEEPWLKEALATAISRWLE